MNGRGHDGSDLDLVLRAPDLQKLPAGQMLDFEDAIRESTIPFLVEARDWACLPERFHREIERDYVVMTNSPAPEPERRVAAGGDADRGTPPLDPGVTLPARYDIAPESRSEWPVVTAQDRTLRDHIQSHAGELHARSNAIRANQGGWPIRRFEELLDGPVRNGIYKGKEHHGHGVKIVNMGEIFAHPRLPFRGDEEGGAFGVRNRALLDCEG